MQGQFEKSLRDLIILSVPVRAIRGNTFYPNCSLRISPDGKSFGLVGLSSGGGSHKIAVSYSLDGYIYGFETRAAITDGLGHTGELTHIGPPRRIARIERRKSFRVTCPKKEPVIVEVEWQGRSVETRAIDISRRSIGLAGVPGMPDFAIGSPLTMKIHLPSVASILAAGTVRAVRDAGATRDLGIHFDRVSEPDGALLDMYVSPRENKAARKARVTGETGRRAREKSFVVTQESDQGKVSYWCPESLIGSILETEPRPEVMPVDLIDFLEAGRG